MTQNPEAKPARVTREDMYPKVGDATEPLKAFIPIFGEKQIELLVEGFKSGGKNFHLEIRQITGEDLQELKVSMEKPENSTLIKVAMEGNWKDKPDVPVGLPLIADYTGKFYRLRHKDDTEPISEVGQVLAPRTPFALGFRGKYDNWFLRLPLRQFPKGGEITAFICVSGEDVKKGETILAYVNPL